MAEARKSQPDEKPAPGDLIEFNRGLFQHWGVYVGDDEVVHLTTSGAPGSSANSVASVMNEKGIVKRDELQNVAGSSKWTVKNSLDEDHKARPADVIVKEACDLVGQQRSYSAVNRNCEHFATGLRYGEAKSNQVEKARDAVVAAGPVVAAALGVAALAGAALSSQTRRQ